MAQGRRGRKDRGAVRPRPDPTPERLAKAGGDLLWGRGDRGARTGLTLLDSPLDRALARGIISTAQHETGRQFLLHWYLGGMAGGLRSPSLDRILAASPRHDFLPGSAAQAWHRQRYCRAVETAGVVNARLLRMIICEEQPLEAAGRLLGWRSRPAAIVAATERLRAALDQVAGSWRQPAS